MSKIKFGTGNVTIELKDDVADAIESIVNKLLPETRKKIEKELDEIKQNAIQKWPVRAEESQDSRSRMYSEIVVTSQLQLVGNVGNSAEYAWAILVGEDPQRTGLSTGQRVSNRLLFRPVKKRSDAMAEVIADETVQLFKKG